MRPQHFLDWLNEDVVCPDCDGKGIIYYRISPKEKKRDCLTCETRKKVKRWTKYAEEEDEKWAAIKL